MKTVALKTSRAAALLLVGLAPISEAFASSGAEPSISDLFVHWGNFVVYVALMFVLLRKPAAQGWRARRSRIKDLVSRCTDDVETAERELNAIEALTKGVTSDQERARQEILAQAKAEADVIVEQARSKAARILAQAKETLGGEGRAAESSFRAALVAKAVEIAQGKFSSGEFAGRQSAYVDTALGRARRLLQ